MSTCKTCNAASQLFLCNPHIDELRELLQSMAFCTYASDHHGPGLIEHLTDAAEGRVKLGKGGRSSARKGMHGDDEAIVKCRCGHPEHENVACRVIDLELLHVTEIVTDDDGNETEVVRSVEIKRTCSCDDYEPAVSQSRLQAQFLRSGGVNARAGRLLARVINTLTTWARDLAETHGLEMDAENAEECARWLAANVARIAGSEAAGECLSEMRHLVGRIEQAINRPLPPRLFGPCPAIITDQGGRERRCAISLEAARDALRVTCPACGTEHDVRELNVLLLNETAEMRFTLADAYRIMLATRDSDDAELPKRARFYAICAKARREGLLKPRGWERANGRETVTWHGGDDVPLFRLEDVRKVLAERNTKVGRPAS